MTGQTEADKKYRVISIYRKDKNGKPFLFKETVPEMNLVKFGENGDWQSTACQKLKP